ncbi:MAG: phosphatase PAP2 family protein [Clostridiales bacterium]|nr:phosphatase PAP2 family protein [Clostridiales bacterium]
MKEFFKKCSHAWILSYFLIYLIWFFIIGKMSAESFHAVEVSLDSLIPFNEWFIIPYFIWFPYIPLTIAYFFLTSREEYYRTCMFLFIGMTICLIAYTVYPTGIYFRPNLDSLGRNNFAIEMTRFIYSIDPGTNACPSIHCFNSIGVAIAVLKSKKLNKKKWLTTGVVLLSTSICMSTVFVKQHSIIDFFFAVALAILMYCIAYVPKYDKLFAKTRLKPELIESFPIGSLVKSKE